MHIFLRRSLAHIHELFFCRYIWGLAPPPPHGKKLATLLRESPPPLGVQYIILNNRNRFPPPLVLKSYTFGGFLELEFMLIQT